MEKRPTLPTRAGAFASNGRGTTVVRLSDYRSSRRASSPPIGPRAVEGSASQQGKLAGPPLLPPTTAAPFLPVWRRRCSEVSRSFLDVLGRSVAAALWPFAQIRQR